MQFTCPVPATAELQAMCGLPLGVVVQPLAAPPGGPALPPATCWAGELARCARCLAYINSLCEVDARGWACALCGCANDFSSAAGLRRYYGAGEELRGRLPELSSPAVDAACPLAAADPEEGREEVDALAAAPAVLALVDACWGGEGEAQAVASALAAALEALPPEARFGLVSFGSQITLYQVAADGGGVTVLRQPAAEAEATPLEAVAQLGSVLAPVGRCRGALQAAIEGLAVEPPAGGGRERALGPALRAVLRWVATGAAAAAAGDGGGAGGSDGEGEGAELSEEGEAEAALPAAQGFPGMRLLLFLSGPPNAGPGAVVAPRTPAADPAAARKAAEAAAERAAKEMAGLLLDPAYPELSAWGDAAAERAEAEAAAAAVAAAAAAAATSAAGDLSHAAPPGVAPRDLVVEPAAAQFYAQAGAAAAALGVAVDIFAACPRWMGVSLLEPLASSSGGTLLLYPSLEHAPLPQDVYKCVTQPRAFACLLRVRCSPEVALTGYYGRLTADREEEGLFRMVSCGPGDAIALELERSDGAAGAGAAAVQLALQYSVLLPVAVQGGRSRWVLQRRMRIATAAAPLAPTTRALLQGCDAEATACLAAHKALEAAAAGGAAAARTMLVDWLVLLAARAADPEGRLHQGGPRRRRRDAEPAAVPEVDASLSGWESLQQLPHTVYALLRGPLLQLPGAGGGSLPGGSHPESAAALRARLPCLPPDECGVALCPQLSSWRSPDEVAVWRHSLSTAALALSQQPIWVLDTYSHLICLYTRAGDDGGGGEGGGAAAPPPFPPPAASLLRRSLAAVRAARRPTPDLLLLREGVHDAAPFYAWLLEDAPPPPPAAAAGVATAAAAATRGPFDAATDSPPRPPPPGQQGPERGEQQQQQQDQPPSFAAFLEAVSDQAREVLLAGA